MHANPTPLTMRAAMSCHVLPASAYQTLAIFVTLVVGIGWVMEGVMALAESWALPSSGWAVLYAVLSIVAGVTLLFSPAGSAVFLAIFCGVALIVTGISALIRAFTFGRPRKR